MKSAEEWFEKYDACFVHSGTHGDWAVSLIRDIQADALREAAKDLQGGGQSAEDWWDIGWNTACKVFAGRFEARAAELEGGQVNGSNSAQLLPTQPPETE